MARALAASGVSIFANASMYSRRAGGAESLRNPMANPFTAIGSWMVRIFSQACCWRSLPSQPRHRFSFCIHSC